MENGQKELRADNAAFREQAHAENQQLREEMRESNRILREEMRELIGSESEQTRAEIRRLADAMLSHFHDEDGNSRFSVPPA